MFCLLRQDLTEFGDYLVSYAAYLARELQESAYLF